MTTTPPPPHGSSDADGDLDDDDRAAVDYMRELIRLERAGERATIRVGPFAAMTIIGLLQLATRHPGMQARQRQVARDFIRQMEPMFAGSYGETIIRQGGHPEFDR